MNTSQVANLITQMSNSYRSDCHRVEELVQLGTTFREHRKEKDNLQSSQLQCAQPIQILEGHEKSLSIAHIEDKQYIQHLEKELLNCSQEIDYLQDQLSAKNTEVNYLEERICNLELKSKEAENLQKEVSILREEVKRSISKQFSLIRELETKEVELEQSALSIQKLEESFSSMALESQFEVESMKLEMMALEQNLFEAKKFPDETLEENIRMSRLIDELQNAQKIIISLNEENKELKEKLDDADMNTRFFSQKVEDWLGTKDRSQLENQCSLGEQWSKVEDTRTYGKILAPLLGRLSVVLDSAAELKGKMEMPRQIQEYEFLVEKLKEELKKEKLRAKEEAEDLVQEMAELRYQLTGLLEEECKRRACIENVSLQRISELEAQEKVKTKQHFVIARKTKMKNSTPFGLTYKRT